MVFVTTGVTPKSIFGIAYTPDDIMRVTIGMNMPRIAYAPTSAKPRTRNPVNVPSRVAPSSTSCTCPRPCVMPRRFSWRLSIQRTARPDLVRERRHYQLLRVDAALGAEPAADPRRAHAYLRDVETERAGNLSLHAEHGLRRRPDRQRPIGLRHRDTAVGLHGHRRHALVRHAHPNDDVGVVEELGVGDARDGAHEVGAVLREQQRRAVGRGRDRIGNRGKWLDLRGDLLRGVDRLRERVGEHHGDRLTDETDAVARQQRPPERFLAREGALVREGQIGGRPHRMHARALGGGLRVNSVQGAVGNVRAHEHRVERAFDLEVGHEPGAAVQEARILRAQHRVTEDGSRHRERTLTAAIRLAGQGPLSTPAGPHSHWRNAMAVTRTDLSDIDLLDPDAFVAQKHHEWFRRLREEAPVYWYDDGGDGGFWNLVKHEDVVMVNRDSALFSSEREGTQIFSRRRAARDGHRPRRAAGVRRPWRDHARDGPAEAHALPAPREQGVHPADDRPARAGAAHPSHAHHRPGRREG